MSTITLLENVLNIEQLEFCFDAVSCGTIAENNSCKVEFIKTKIKCGVCGKRT